MYILFPIIPIMVNYFIHKYKIQEKHKKSL